jgi:hypothetical protein
VQFFWDNSIRQFVLTFALIEIWQLDRRVAFCRFITEMSSFAMAEFEFELNLTRIEPSREHSYVADYGAREFCSKIIDIHECKLTEATVF